MKILFLGGTGTISTACSRLAIAGGFEVTLLNRSRRETIGDADTIIADINDPKVGDALAGKTWDVVVDFIAYDVDSIEQRLRLFRGRTSQYLFISTTSAYQRPLVLHLITESTPLVNPYWD